MVAAGAEIVLGGAVGKCAGEAPAAPAAKDTFAARFMGAGGMSASWSGGAEGSTVARAIDEGALLTIAASTLAASRSSKSGTVGITLWAAPNGGTDATAAIGGFISRLSWPSSCGATARNSGCSDGRPFVALALFFFSERPSQKNKPPTPAKTAKPPRTIPATTPVERAVPPWG